MCNVNRCIGIACDHIGCCCVNTAMCMRTIYTMGNNAIGTVVDGGYDIGVCVVICDGVGVAVVRIGGDFDGYCMALVSLLIVFGLAIVSNCVVYCGISVLYTAVLLYAVLLVVSMVFGKSMLIMTLLVSMVLLVMIFGLLVRIVVRINVTDVNRRRVCYQRRAYSGGCYVDVADVVLPLLPVCVRTLSFWCYR